MNVEKLSQHVKAKEVKEINLVSMEGGSYVIHALHEGSSVPVQGSKGETLHVASVEEARKLLAGVEDVDLYLVQPAIAHDEMVGLDDAAGGVSKEHIPLRSSL